MAVPQRPVELDVKLITTEFETSSLKIKYFLSPGLARFLSKITLKLISNL